MPTLIENLVNQPGFSRIRRNHGLEHATIHILSRKFPGMSLAGHSDRGGFWLLGNLNATQIRAGVDEALKRLRAGEHGLAIHPNCGTNLVTSGLFAGVAGAVAMSGVGPRSRDKAERIPLAAFLATLALLASKPAGTRIQQRITTSGIPGDLEIVDILPSQRNGLNAHRVTTQG
jgi:hypothetical protein